MGAQTVSKPKRNPYVVRTAGTCGGRARLDGTRVPVWQVASSIVRRGMSPEEFVQEYSYVTLAQVHAALSYYYDHRAEIDRDLRDQDEAWRKRAGRRSR